MGQHPTEGLQASLDSLLASPDMAIIAKALGGRLPKVSIGDNMGSAKGVTNPVTQDITISSGTTAAELPRVVFREMGQVKNIRDPAFFDGVRTTGRFAQPGLDPMAESRAEAFAQAIKLSRGDPTGLRMQANLDQPGVIAVLNRIQSLMAEGVDNE